MEYWKKQPDRITSLLRGAYAQSTRFDNISLRSNAQIQQLTGHLTKAITELDDMVQDLALGNKG